MIRLIRSHAPLQTHQLKVNSNLQSQLDLLLYYGFAQVQEESGKFSLTFTVMSSFCSRLSSHVRTSCSPCREDGRGPSARGGCAVRGGNERHGGEETRAFKHSGYIVFNEIITIMSEFPHYSLIRALYRMFDILSGCLNLQF